MHRERLSTVLQLGLAATFAQLGTGGWLAGQHSTGGSLFGAGSPGGNRTAGYPAGSGTANGYAQTQTWLVDALLPLWVAVGLRLALRLSHGWAHSPTAAPFGAAPNGGALGAAAAALGAVVTHGAEAAVEMVLPALVACRLDGSELVDSWSLALLPLWLVFGAAAAVLGLGLVSAAARVLLCSCSNSCALVKKLSRAAGARLCGSSDGPSDGSSSSHPTSVASRGRAATQSAVRVFQESPLLLALTSWALVVDGAAGLLATYALAVRLDHGVAALVDQGLVSDHGGYYTAGRSGHGGRGGWWPSPVQHRAAADDADLLVLVPLAVIALLGDVLLLEAVALKCFPGMSAATPAGRRASRSASGASAKAAGMELQHEVWASGAGGAGGGTPSGEQAAPPPQNASQLVQQRVAALV